MPKPVMGFQKSVGGSDFNKIAQEVAKSGIDYTIKGACEAHKEIKGKKGGGY